MSADVSVDRRRLRHQQTVDEVVATALEVMTESGAGAMTLGEVARRMGIRPPSLYVYFRSKDALHDEIFARGWIEAAEAMHTYEDDLVRTTDAGAFLVEAATGFVRWALEHPAYAQLMFWRPIPGWEPSTSAYEPAVRLLDWLGASFTTLQQRGYLDRKVELDELVDVWNVLITGLISQQLANEPKAKITSSRYFALIGPVVQTYLARYGTAPTPVSRGKKR
ncbi:MAG: TetR/AcrR family transcriptional regulator [Candidatus Nanopelagicales bacterium]